MSDSAETIERNLESKGYKHKLEQAVQKWPTPMAQGAGGSGHYQMVEKLYLDNKITYEEKMAMQAGRGGKLNPTWVEWLMGFPIGWTAVPPQETPSTPESPKRSGGAS